MSIEKSELRAAAVHDLGTRIDDGLEKAVAQKNQALGAIAAHEKGVRDITVLKFKVQEDVEDGTLDLEEAKIILRWIDRAVNICSNLQKQAFNISMKAEGVEIGLKAAIEITSNAHTTELAKGQVQEAKSEDDGGRRMTIKQRRQAEEKKPAAKKASKKKTTKKKVATKKG